MIKRILPITSVFTALALAFMLAGCAATQSVKADAGSLYGKVDAWVRQAMDASRVPGVAVGIVKGTETVYLKGFGTAGEGREVTPQTPFVIASVSKSVTALAVLQLSEGGMVDLDAPAAKYVPDFKTADPAASGAITVRMLLNQTSGFSTESGHRLNLDNGGKPIGTLVAMLRAETLVSRPGEAFHYSNANYVLLAAVAERVSGESYSDYVREHIFMPLEMGGSAVEPDAALSGRMASGYKQWFGFPVEMPPFAHVACLNNVSTAEDMARYLTALMNGGTAAGVSVCSADTLKNMMRPAAPMGGGAGYAMGIEAKPSGSGTLLWHPGDAPGYAADIMMTPEGFGVVVLQNANWLGMEGSTAFIANGVVDILQGRDPPSVLFSPGNMRLLFDAIYLATLILLAMSFLRLGRWRRRLGALPKEKRMRKLIPVFMVNFTIPVGMALFLPKFFAADWAQGFLNAPDFSMTMLLIAALLFILGVIRTAFILLGRKKEQAA